MQLSGNTILITGGGSGIGRGLAEAFHALDNQVIITGRRTEMLERVTAVHPGMKAVALDVADSEAIRTFAAGAATRFPTLNVLINNAGLQRPEDVQTQDGDLVEPEAMVTTNLLGPIRLTAALLPLIRKQPRSVVMNVSSGLAFVPAAGVPTYSATKAALHSYTLSLRQQLRDTSTSVIELIPPYVQTDLGPGHGSAPRALPLAAFLHEVMSIVGTQSEVEEVVVERCRPLRFAEASGQFPSAFARVSGAT